MDFLCASSNLPPRAINDDNEIIELTARHNVNTYIKNFENGNPNKNIDEKTVDAFLRNLSIEDLIALRELFLQTMFLKKGDIDEDDFDEDENKDDQERKTKACKECGKMFDIKVEENKINETQKQNKPKCLSFNQAFEHSDIINYYLYQREKNPNILL